jgi:hypothetical protein
VRKCSQPHAATSHQPPVTSAPAHQTSKSKCESKQSNHLTPSYDSNQLVYAQTTNTHKSCSNERPCSSGGILAHEGRWSHNQQANARSSVSPAQTECCRVRIGGQRTRIRPRVTGVFEWRYVLLRRCKRPATTQATVGPCARNDWRTMCEQRQPKCDPPAIHERGSKANGGHKRHRVRHPGVAPHVRRHRNHHHVRAPQMCY